ncbi:MAG TPA: cytochrome c biogenesis protein CcdA [Anaerolineales bacterium]|nr:cytochrome c biogenesis protein CcdA [Anaerolineales bacterium]
MNPENVTVPLAFLAGLASFLSPCVMALVPAYIGYLSGRSVTTAGVVVENRWATFAHGAAFVLGFSAVFVILGAAASLIGAVLYDLRTWLARIGGLVVIVFGLHTMGVIHIPFLDYDLRRTMRPTPGLNFTSSFLMGVFFSAGWAPCVGPVLGAILTLALSSGSLNLGVVLLVAYSAGLAIPFLLAALGIGRIAEWMRLHGRAVLVVSRVTGVVLVIVGFLLLTGALERLAQYGFFVNFGL